MARTSMFFGVLLIVLGLVGYYRPVTFGDVGPEGTSPTALIPAAIGAVLLLCGLVARAKPDLRKHVMHLAAAAGLIGAIGGFMPIMRNKMDTSKSGTVAGILMVTICVVFVAACIRSFVLARIARAEGLPDEPYAEERRSRQKPT
jgi:nitrate/nitrite transporter NarK